MPDKTPEDSIAAIRRLPSIRLLLTLIAVAPALVVSVVLVIIATLTGRHVAEDLAQQTMRSNAARASDQVRNYLAQAVRMSDLYTRRIDDRQLPAKNFERAWLKEMADDLATTPQVASICFGNPQGQSTWLLRAHGRLEFGLGNGAGETDAIEYEAQPTGTIATTQPLRVYRYDPRTRPWYSAATTAAEPIWTPIYFWFSDRGADSETGTGYTRPVKSADGSTVGVLVVDVTLSALSTFLRDLPLAETGWVFIIDEQNLLVAASRGAVNSPSAERLPIHQADGAAPRAVAAWLDAKSHNNDRIDIAGAVARVNATPLNPYPGIHWKLITVLPESVFLSDVRTMQRRAIAMGSIAVVAALLFGLRLSRRLAQPLVALAAHVGRVGAGEFDARLDLSQARELKQLSGEINKMAAGLKHRIELEQSLALATHVQQSLLPAGAPTFAGADIAGHSRYCDSTGGDYFDFLDVADLPGKQLLIAVGDVTGHGIGAALLMATARGSVRSSVSAGVSLASVMDRVNHVISSDTRHGLYMTLSLLVLDPASRNVRYTSAGHDPPIIYDPATDQFEELEGGDVPLGVMDGIVFEEYRRDRLPESAILIIGTDGIWEARNTSDELFGKERLRDLIRSHRHATAAELAKTIDQTLEQYVRPNRPQDDVTFVIVRLTARATP